MSSLAPTTPSLSIDIEVTLRLLEELEGIKATASFYKDKAFRAREIGPDFYSSKDMRLNLKRNELVAAWKSIALRIGHPFVNERFNDTSRELSLLCSTLDNERGASLKDKFLLGTVALTEKFSLSMFDRLLKEKVVEPTQREFSTSPLPSSPPAKTSSLSWLFASIEPTPSSQDLIVLPFPEVPTFDLTPKKNLSPLFNAIRDYWKSLKPTFFNNIACLLKGKIRLSLINKYPEFIDIKDCAPHIKNFTDIEKYLTPLKGFECTIIDAAQLFLKATNSWTTISKLYDSGIDTIDEAAKIAAFDNQCYLKLASMKIRLVALTTLIENRARRYKEEFTTVA